MKKSIAPLLFGIVFILAGIGYLGSVVLGWDFDVFFAGWWTLFIIVPSFISILSNGPRGFNLAAFFIGIVLLLSEQIPQIFSYKTTGVAIVAVVIISIGVTLITNYFRKPNSATYFNYQQNNTYQTPPQGNAGATGSYNTAQPKGKNWSYDATNCPNYNAILSGVDTKNTSTNFEGARVSAIMGGVDLDLRDAVVTHDITVYVTAIMGGVDIFAPQNVKIAINKTDILGGTECRAYTMPAESGAPVVTFVCTTVMGGIEIK
ncbi:MAG: LiaF domain-containing protein [Oscillospiraceae bacterium]